MAKDARWDPSETVQVGKDIFGVASEVADRLARRNITAAFLDECRTAVAQAEAAASGQPLRLGEQKGATLALDQVFASVNTMVMAVRAAVQRVYPRRKDLHEAFGVGEPTVGSVKGALAAIDAVLTAAAGHPTETTNAGVLEDDLTELRALRDQVRAADGAQESKKGSKKSGTAARDDLLRDITQRVDRILAVAGLEFAKEPAILERFTAPIPTKRKKKAQPTK